MDVICHTQKEPCILQVHVQLLRTQAAKVWPCCCNSPHLEGGGQMYDVFPSTERMIFSGMHLGVSFLKAPFYSGLKGNTEAILGVQILTNRTTPILAVGDQL